MALPCPGSGRSSSPTPRPSRLTRVSSLTGVTWRSQLDPRHHDGRGEPNRWSDDHIPPQVRIQGEEYRREYSTEDLRPGRSSPEGDGDHQMSDVERKARISFCLSCKKDTQTEI